MVALLAEHGAHLDASYYCPDLPSEKSGCRKPNSTLFRKAIREHSLDASHPLFVGDRWRDLAPILELGGDAILVLSNSTTEEDLATAQKYASVVPSLQIAIDQVLR
jgi:D-glycero-D-manno-heptose 1,7-bisphosphate phosphatase